MKVTSLEPLGKSYAAETLHRQLCAAGVQGPHSFIRGLNAEYDRDITIRRWLETMSTDSDQNFRVVVDGREFWILMELLPWDSEFFGRRMARLNAFVRPGIVPGLREDSGLGAQALAAVMEQVRRGGVDYILAPVSPGDLHGIRVLGKNGFELIETRCHYHRALSAPPEHHFATRLATPEDIPSLARAAKVMVNPFDRFHADMSISETDADRMMERWVEASILNGFADATVVPDEEAPEAFCTAKYHREHWSGWGLKVAQPVLSAVSPRHRGWYVRIIAELDEHLRSIGAEHSFLITQITNNAVIRSWEKLGYQFGKGEHIFRKLL